ncbi:MAG: iron-containing alcohol dehydrogenase [Bacteroidales bacterium]|nr:iron-containing alcohol dehydrogenase [Bacteroidales bacterium]
MNNFEFHNPTKLIFGKGTISNLDKLIAPEKKILLTYGGGSIKKNGVYDQVKKALKNHNVIEFGGIEPNPKYETLLKAVELVKKENIDFLLPVGGGSVIDGTKFIAAAVKLDSDPWNILNGKAQIKAALPIGAILTLPATGTEMNGNSVISKLATKEKYGFSSKYVYPVFSILDPETCFSLPDIQIANGIVDAFVHVMEQYLTYPVNSPLQDRMAESILITLTEVGPKALKNKTDYNEMANFMWCATMALNGAISRGVAEDWTTHIIGHELTALHEIDHAQTLAVVLPGVMSVMRENKKEKILQYGQRVWGVNSSNANTAIDETIAKTEQFFESMGIPTKLNKYSVGQDTIDTIVKRFTDRKSVFGEKGDVNPDAVRKILEIRK